MGLKQCPICELNYISESKDMCDICRRARYGGLQQDESIFCVICGDNFAEPGDDMCASCRREKSSSESDTVLDTVTFDELPIPTVDDDDDTPMINDDVADGELDVIVRAFGIDDIEDEVDENLERQFESETDEFDEAEIEAEDEEFDEEEFDDDIDSFTDDLADESIGKNKLGSL